MRRPSATRFIRIRTRTAAMLAVVAVVGLVAFAVIARRPDAPPKEPRAHPIEFTASEVTTLQTAVLGQTLPITGSFEAVNKAILRAKVAAEVRAVPVREGDHVAVGQFVAQMDTTDLEARLLQQQGALDAAKANAAQSQRNLVTNKELLAKGFISQNAFDAIESTHQANIAQVQAAEGGVALARNALRDARMAAPFAGTIAKRHVQTGDKVTLDAPVVTIVDLRKLELQALVPAVEVPRLRLGAIAKLHVDGFDGKTFDGRVERIAPSTEPGTRAVLVVISVDNPDERLKSGMFASGEVDVDRTAPVASLPTDAVQSANGMNYVWTIVDGKLARRTVRIGRHDDLARRVEIVEGLTAREPVLAARFDNLHEGTLAQIKAAPAPTMPASSTPPSSGLHTAKEG